MNGRQAYNIAVAKSLTFNCPFTAEVCVKHLAYCKKIIMTISMQRTEDIQYSVGQWGGGRPHPDKLPLMSRPVLTMLLILILCSLAVSSLGRLNQTNIMFHLLLQAPLHWADQL